MCVSGIIDANGIKQNAGFFLIQLLLIFLGFGFCSAADEQKQVSEYKIKAVYLYNFLLFTNWPSKIPVRTETENPITIGILGTDPFKNCFDEVEGTIVKSLNRKLCIKRFGPYSDRINLKECQLLFIASSEKENLIKIISVLKGAPLLTVGDTDGFLAAGVMINLVSMGGKIRWEINRRPIDAAGLRLDAQVFQSAVKIVDVPY